MAVLSLNSKVAHVAEVFEGKYLGSNTKNVKRWQERIKDSGAGNIPSSMDMDEDDSIAPNIKDDVEDEDVLKEVGLAACSKQVSLTQGF